MGEVQSESVGKVRERAIDLFSYLRDLTQLKTTPVRSLDQYEQITWFSDIPQQAGCESIAWEREKDRDTTPWIEIQAPKLKDPPEPPEALVPWLERSQIKDSSIEYPDLLDQIAVDDPDTGESKFVSVDEAQGVEAAWEDYIDKRWWPWAEQDKKLQVVQGIYTDLFSMYQKQQKMGEEYEVVVGFGFLTWDTPNSSRVSRHLVTAKTSIAFDSTQGVITVSASADGAKAALEQDMLEPEDRPDPRQLIDLEDRLKSFSEEDVWDPRLRMEVLGAWVHSCSATGRYESGLDRHKGTDEDPRVSFAPALILRKRTQKSMQQLIQDILTQLQDGAEVPSGLGPIIGEISAEVGDNDDGAEWDEDGQGVDDLLFPLPSNEEQRQVALAIRRQKGVLVQGPPGTGKSLTIVNLVCDLLSRGKRILVTSHTARALQVLQDKFPSQLKSLCVSLVGNDHESIKRLEDSVQGITENYNNWNAASASRAETTASNELGIGKERIAKIYADLRDIRIAETDNQLDVPGGYRGTLQAIGTSLRETDEALSWLTGAIDEESEFPLNDTDVVELSGWIVGADPEYCRIRISESDRLEGLPNVDECKQIFHELDQTQEKLALLSQQGAHQALASLTMLGDADLAALHEQTTALTSPLQKLLKHIEPWAEQCAKEVLGERDRSWRELLKVSDNLISDIGNSASVVDETEIVGIGDRDELVVLSDAMDLLGHLKSGGGLGWGPFRATIVKRCTYVWQSVRVGGRSCSSANVIELLCNILNTKKNIKSLKGYWKPLTNISAPNHVSTVALVEDLCEPLRDAMEIHERLQAVVSSVEKHSLIGQPTWHELDELCAFTDAIELVFAQRKIERAETAIKNIRQVLIGSAPALKKVESFTNALAAIDDRSLTKLSSALERIIVDEHNVSILRKLYLASGPVSKLVLECCGKPELKGRVTSLKGAWNWSRANTWFDKVTDSKRSELLLRELDRAHEDVAKATIDVGQARAWRHCFSRMTEHEREHLVAWTKSMRRVGKGTGKYASMHRRAAQEHMAECRSAIPAWIMPLYRVAETIRPSEDRFDVAIIDEASQSGPEAMILLYLADKIVVVGDDKQVSPEHVGVNREQVEALRQRFLSGFPQSRELGSLETSFFDLAEIKYPGRIRLREHFRCMPEIIQFSNNLCYRSEPLVPLKQVTAGRLQPVICTRYVKGGFVEGSRAKVNRPEAEALVDQIVELCSDDAYKGKMFGVISLLGTAQSKHIERLLLERIGPEEIENRAIVCGDAAAFQGDERDIMFLSLVSAPVEGKRIPKLGDQRSERRFNVAVSRAKEQLWLFHSAALTDLNSECLRHNLIAYCQDPKLEQVEVGVDLNQLRHAANVSDRSNEKPPKPFDSWFEVDVFFRIVDRGFRVIPQYQIAGKYVDLLIEGMQGNLAVECDGDYWHGPEEEDRDRERERTLERAGLEFWRIRGSVFQRDPEEAMQSLWSLLDRLGIRSGSASASESDASKLKPASEVVPDINDEADADGPKQNVLFESPTGDQEPNLFSDLTTANGEDDASPTDTVEDAPKPAEIEEGRLGRALQLANVPDREGYTSWTRRKLDDPHEASQAYLAEAMLEIIEAEGPVLCNRVFQQYGRGAGCRIGRQIQSKLRRALNSLMNKKKVVASKEHAKRDMRFRILRTPDTAEVIVRSRGERTFPELPPSEIRAVMKSLLKSERKADEEWLFRSVMEHFEFRRMTSNIRDTLWEIRQTFELDQQDP